MKATKYTVTIELEVLSMDVVRTQLIQVLDAFSNEHINGYLSSEDGDNVAWSTHAEEVEF
jgi:hypothetical protein